MKYIFFVIVSTLLLAGCGQSDEPAVAETQETSDASGASAEPSAPVPDEASGDSGTTAASEQADMSADSPSAQSDTQSANASGDSSESAATESNSEASVAATIAAKANKKASIRAEASSSSEAVTSIDKNSDISLGSRSGIWYAVQSPAEGWIKISDVTFPNKDDGSSALAGFFSGRMGSGNSVASTGARGLTSEDVVTSTPDFEAVEELNALQNSGDSLGNDFFDDQEERNITDSNG